MDKSQKQDLCRRISRLREKLCGSRGKSAFAKQLGLSPSTYDYYENGRIPPAEILVAIADLAEVDLRWLITGVEPVGPAVSAQHPLVRRVAELLAERSEAAEALAAFVDILSQTLQFPGAARSEESAAGEAGERTTADAASTAGAAEKAGKRTTAGKVGTASTAGAAGKAGARTTAGAASGRVDRSSWIPILGRSAAGVPHFWSPGQSAGVTDLAELIAGNVGRSPVTSRPARSTATPTARPATVQIVTLAEAQPGKAVEFVVDRSITANWPDAFAVRIDGESMAPEIEHGDLIVLSPSAPAVNGKAAVVQLVGQIGVTCKIFRSGDDGVHLVPINEQFAPQVFPADAVQWALRVLARVRP